MLQADINLVVPPVLAGAALLALALAFAYLSGEPNSGMLLLPDKPIFGSTIS